MAVNIRKLPRKKYVMPGNAACPGCPETMGFRYVGMALGEKAVMVIPAGCSSVIQGLWPRQGWGLPVLNIVFAAGAAAASGLARALRRRGIDAQVVVWAGDGGTADIGLQALSAAAERGEDIIYICVDNEAYMNTGIQRSGLTPYGAWTTTTHQGKKEFKKPLPQIVAAHRIPYVATASIGYPWDFIAKLRKAASIRGFKYIHLHAPCPVGWRFDPGLTAKIAQLAVETGMWILYEYENGKLRLNPPSNRLIDPSKRKPIEEYIKLQGRFRHLKPEDIERLRQEVEMNWREITAMLKLQELEERSKT
ncbi:Pyruvate:ferredoxin oxidoreductase, beta subunit [Pyrodictium delaneyi]|uniref:2-oxoacid oxidoreductase (ferredoxin) n=1 Tax=Pyrodictium delaneyi TaxID=1273541 RepID=A0A0P0N446_9CREN|nr:pyruvate synthase subunit PorB [Pyrodictium delaneyi]ALL01492.1 Pyruvate:ferredoxin oxidoreductase, beta subunit [Pyrodictium delaneyi]OWJ54599.1 2-ketoisovalerate ferredoxin oxidoreductase [Pyrodictium delaneyi]